MSQKWHLKQYCTIMLYFSSWGPTFLECNTTVVNTNRNEMVQSSTHAFVNKLKDPEWASTTSEARIMSTTLETLQPNVKQAQQHEINKQVICYQLLINPIRRSLAWHLFCSFSFFFFVPVPDQLLSGNLLGYSLFHFLASSNIIFFSLLLLPLPWFAGLLLPSILSQLELYLPLYYLPYVQTSEGTSPIC